MRQTDAYQRGQQDAARDRPAIFRSTRAHGIVAEGDDPMADNWSDQDRQEYLAGYNS